MPRMQISAKYQPKTADGKQWMNDYHAKLYNLTDEAIRACPRNTRWVGVTNGDNDYDPKFLSVLVQQQDAEVVAFDYYSRYQRPTGACAKRCCMTLPCMARLVSFKMLGGPITVVKDTAAACRTHTRDTPRLAQLAPACAVRGR
eukprot:GHRQ01019939.1.p1 GENE.GHRQ01019939.1~~GHRQ01019939.1.p1  ORF type:complete len:144 (+),score=32.35 GHRQ01019939.1:1188-1619(+)